MTDVDRDRDLVELAAEMLWDESASKHIHGTSWKDAESFQRILFRGKAQDILSAVTPIIERRAKRELLKHLDRDMRQSTSRTVVGALKVGWLKSWIAVHLAALDHDAHDPAATTEGE